MVACCGCGLERDNSRVALVTLKCIENHSFCVTSVPVQVICVNKINQKSTLSEFWVRKRPFVLQIPWFIAKEGKILSKCPFQLPCSRKIAAVHCLFKYYSQQIRPFWLGPGDSLSMMRLCKRDQDGCIWIAIQTICINCPLDLWLC